MQIKLNCVRSLFDIKCEEGLDKIFGKFSPLTLGKLNFNN